MKLIIDIDDNDYGLLNKTGIEIDWNMAFHGKEKDREMTFALFDLVKALKNGKPYDERSQGEWIDYDNTFYKCPDCGYLLEKCCPVCQNKVILPKGGAKADIATNLQPTCNNLQQGEWIGNAFDEHHCSKCGHPALWEEEPDGYYEAQSRFCPNCGADMRSGKEE